MTMTMTMMFQASGEAAREREFRQILEKKLENAQSNNSTENQQLRREITIFEKNSLPQIQN